MFHIQIHIRRRQRLLLGKQMREGLLQQRRQTRKGSQPLHRQICPAIRQGTCSRGHERPCNRAASMPQHVRRLPFLAHAFQIVRHTYGAVVTLGIPKLRGRHTHRHVRQYMFPGKARPQPYIRSYRPQGRPYILPLRHLREVGRQKRLQQL